MCYARVSATAALIGALAIFLPSVSYAAPMVGLSSSVDLATLSVGATATVTVELSGLEAGDELEFLSALVGVGGSGLNVISPADPGVVPGAGVVPDATGFFAGGDAGSADGLYDNLLADSGATITDNGVFYTFEVKAHRPGTGAIEILSSFSLGTASGGGPLAGVTKGGPLAVTVVPEPASGLVVLALAACVGGSRANRRRSRTLLYS